MSKKLLIADQVAPLADRLFDGANTVQFGAAWLGTLAYSIQLYFDFSGYSDMAVGLGLMLGFRFPLNFLSPYRRGISGEVLAQSRFQRLTPPTQSAYSVSPHQLPHLQNHQPLDPDQEKPQFYLLRFFPSTDPVFLLFLRDIQPEL